MTGYSIKKKVGMQEIPILFKSDMVRAILDGKKTQTRRLKIRGDGCKRLWVKENFGFISRFAHRPHKIIHEFKYGGCVYSGNVIYQADGPDAGVISWKPSIFMPRALSRITLTVTDRCVERLTWITEAEANEEGFDSRAEFLAYFRKINRLKGDESPNVEIIKFIVDDFKN